MAYIYMEFNKYGGAYATVLRLSVCRLYGMWLNGAS